jgi:hypothetical protein
MSPYELFYRDYGDKPAWNLSTVFNDQQGGAYTVYLKALEVINELRTENNQLRMLQAQVDSQQRVLLQNADEIRMLHDLLQCQGSIVESISQLKTLHALTCIVNNKPITTKDFKSITVGAIIEAVESFNPTADVEMEQGDPDVQESADPVAVKKKPAKRKTDNNLF